MNQRPHRPASTLVRVAPTRLPQDERKRLARIAQCGADAFARHAKTLRVDAPERAERAELCRELCLGLEIALLDLAGAELRAENAEGRARRAESELATVRRQIEFLRQEDARAMAAEFQAVPTQVRAETTIPESVSVLTVAPAPRTRTSGGR
jgi:hypothetical protein